MNERKLFINRDMNVRDTSGYYVQVDKGDEVEVVYAYYHHATNVKIIVARICDGAEFYVDLHNITRDMTDVVYRWLNKNDCMIADVFRVNCDNIPAYDDWHSFTKDVPKGTPCQVTIDNGEFIIYGACYIDGEVLTFRKKYAGDDIDSVVGVY